MKGSTNITQENNFKIDYTFKLSVRMSINEKEIKKKLKIEDVPLIVDMAINGYSTRNDFDIIDHPVTFKDFRKKMFF